MDAGLAFMARELDDLFPGSVKIDPDGFLFKFPKDGWEEKLFSRLVEQRERRLMQTPAKSNRTGKTLVNRFLPGAGGSTRWGHPVFGKGAPGANERRTFVSLVRQMFDLEDPQRDQVETCGITGQVFYPHSEVYEGRQSIYPFMVDQKQNLGGVREFNFRHNQGVILAGVCAWLASVPFVMFYKGGSPTSVLFYPVTIDFTVAMDLERGFAKLLQFDHSPYGNFRASGGYGDAPFVMLIRLYERYHLDTSRVLPCERWFVLHLAKEGQGYDIRSFECAIPSLTDFYHFFDPLSADAEQEPFGLGTWLSRVWIKALDDRAKERYDDARDRFPEWLDNVARAFLEDDLASFIMAFARTEFGHALYVRGSKRDEFFKVFWTLVDRFSGGDTMDQPFRKGTEAFGRALESFAWHGRSGGGRKDLSHHYKIARSGSYRALVEAVTDAISGMMASTEASGSRFYFNPEARQFCKWWTQHLDTDQLCEDNWWKIKSVLVAAMNMAVVHPQIIQPGETHEIPTEEDIPKEIIEEEATR